ncbi:hypothetical protein CQW23_15122 [Capsicum baccatum]|uniref:Uncharacterized protein n=1 Tax=Capsicum baccatum TaxID=33114 RepID=A0A2G2WL48_CAPBA|nr:hypothetical protein CQW23_15122 [Capsicum baccatum]
MEYLERELNSNCRVEVQKADEEVKPKADEPAPTIVEEVKKVDKEEMPMIEEPPATIIRAKEHTPEPEAQSIPDQVADITKCEPEVQPEDGNVETLDKESKIKPAEEKT